MSVTLGKSGILAFAALILAAGGAAAKTPGCSPERTEIRISKAIVEPRIDYSKRATQLETMQFRDPLASDRSFTRVAGLTVAAVTVDSEIRIASTGTAAGEPACVWPSVVTVTLSTAPTVYVGADHGQCSRDVGVGHEMEHVAIDKNVINMYGPIFRLHLVAMADAMNASPEPGLDPAAWRARIEEKMNAVIAVVSDSLNDDRSLRHRQLDSPQEYQRLSVACPQVTLNPNASAARARTPTMN